MALWWLGFAAVNVALEMTDHFEGGVHAAYASGLSVVNWFVAVLKVVGASVALLSLARTSRPSRGTVTAVVLWGGFATLGIYALGSVGHAVGIVSGLAGPTIAISRAGTGYVLLFLLAASCYGVLAISHSRRYGLGWRPAVLGTLGAPDCWGSCSWPSRRCSTPPGCCRHGGRPPRGEAPWVLDVGRDQVARLMRAAGIEGARRSKRVRTIRADPANARHPDLVGRAFRAEAPNQLGSPT